LQALAKPLLAAAFTGFQKAVLSHEGQAQVIKLLGRGRAFIVQKAPQGGGGHGTGHAADESDARGRGRVTHEVALVGLGDSQNQSAGVSTESDKADAAVGEGELVVDLAVRVLAGTTIDDGLIDLTAEIGRKLGVKTGDGAAGGRLRIGRGGSHRGTEARRGSWILGGTTVVLGLI
jgi:hypothetical protein